MWSQSRKLSDTIVRELGANFQETGSLQNKRTQSENSELNNPVELAVLGKVAMDGTMRTRHSAGVTGASDVVQEVFKGFIRIRLNYCRN